MNISDHIRGAAASHLDSSTGAFSSESTFAGQAQRRVRRRMLDAQLEPPLGVENGGYTQEIPGVGICLDINMWDMP